MLESNLLRAGTCCACIVLLSHCEHPSPQTSCASTNSCASVFGSGGSGAMSPSAAAAPSGGSVSGGAPASAGSTAAGRNAAATAGVPAAAGGSPASGLAGMASTAPVAGMAASAGMPAAGASGMGGAPGAAGAPATGVDHNGVALAKAGDTKLGSREYLNLGDFRLLVNKWGSDELGCNTSMQVFANSDKSFGWKFDRAGCGGNKQKPDYPEIEFGIHPFGAGNSLATTPSFPSTTVLPLQIKDITSASVALDGMTVSIQKATTWNVDFELWLSQKNPVTEANPGVYAELIAFWGWQDDWACDKSGAVTAGDKSYTLCHQDDAWANGQWRYYQFRANGGPFQSYSGKLDIKAFLDYLVNTRGFSKDLWVTRFEVGSELDDNTAGTVNLKNITFEVNGTMKSARFGP